MEEGGREGGRERELITFKPALNLFLMPGFKLKDVLKFCYPIK